jgi:hypothetical protein
MKTELENIEMMSPLKLFKPKFMPTLLKAIEIEVSANVPNVDTADGRKAITSLAYKVARSKTTIDDLGKNHVAGIKAEAAAVDSIRKIARDFLDDLKIKVRAPLTTWENDEQDRVNKINGKILTIESLGDITDDVGKLMTSVKLEANLVALRKVKVTKIYAEYQDDAINKLNAAIVAVMDAIPIAKSAEREIADQLVANKKLAEEQRVENEQRIAREAVEASEGEAKRELEQRDATAAAEKAEQDKRDRNTQHKGKINREAAAAIAVVTADQELAKAIVSAIVKGKIPNVTINY